MKIGILTFHRAINYGAVLQCYALSEALKTLGHDVEVIDYRPESIERYRMFYSPLQHKGISLLAKVKAIIISLLFWKKKQRANKAFDSFLNSKLNISRERITCADQEIAKYDIIIFGSDQIWNKTICYGLDKVYWGQFPHPNTRLVTYAASIGATNVYTDDEVQIMRQYIKSYDKLSVRERSLKNYLSETLHVDSSLVSDPTFLIDKSVYEHIAIKPALDRYVLLFVLEGNYAGALAIAESLAQQLDCPVVHLSAQGSIFKYKDSATHIENLSPEEFLGYYRYATCCVGISFHATAFSLVFRKDFYCVSSPMQDRSLNLMKTIGVEDRLVKVGEDVIFSKIDYTDKEKNYDSLRAESIEYLKAITK